MNDKLWHSISVLCSQLYCIIYIPVLLLHSTSSLNQGELAVLLKNQLVLPVATFFLFFMLAEDLWGDPSQGTDVG